MPFQTKVEVALRTPEEIAAEALRAKVEHAVEEIARLACEVDGKHLNILTEALNAAAKDMRAAIVSQWGDLTAQQLAVLLRAHPKSR
ncbi:hypothetical protein ACI2UY_22270 [Ralstonia nicotianae]